MKFQTFRIFLAALALNAVHAHGAQLTLPELEAMMLENSQAIQAAAAQTQAARAAVDTASALPNPVVEVLSGTRALRSGVPITTDNRIKTLSLTQDLDMPWHRFPRVDAALAYQDAAQAHQRSYVADMLAKLRLRYFDLLRRQSEERAALEDKALMENIRSRIALRVETGEAARYELVKADAETLNAQKLAQSAQFKVRQSRAALRALVGSELPEDFAIAQTAWEMRPPQSLAEIRDSALAHNPELAQARAIRRQQAYKLSEEKALRLPKLALRAESDQDPEYNSKRIGVALEVPLWNWRTGPVGEAAARLAQAQSHEAYQEFALQQSLEAAYQQYEIANAQMVALESGIVRQAANALKIVEIAYKAGEKGFLEVLDAQRVYRAARNELITARYEVASAWAEIERLRAPNTPSE